MKSITVGAGTVVSQNPAPKVSQKEGTVIHVVPSAGPPIVTVPSLTGMTCATATAQLQQDHFKAVCAPPRYDNNTPVGQLVLWSIGSTPNPSKAPYGSTITLVPSQGHSPVNVPHHSDLVHLRPGAGRAVGGGADGDATEPVVDDGAERTGDLDQPRQRPAGTVRLGGDGRGLDGAADDDRAVERDRASRSPRRPRRCTRPASACRASRATRARTSSGRSPRSGRRCRRARPIQLFTQGH